MPMPTNQNGKKHFKEKKCKNSRCNKKFIPARSMQAVCSVSCAYAYAEEKRVKQEKKEWSIKKKEIKEKLKTLGQYKAEARTVFQRWIRMRDEKLPCISCGRTKSKQWDAGHYLKAEIYTGLIFSETNTNKQCAHCNNWLSGNEVNYRQGMIKKYGLRAVAELEAIKDSFRQYKFTKEELIEIKNIYNQRIKDNDFGEPLIFLR